MLQTAASGSPFLTWLAQLDLDLGHLPGEARMDVRQGVGVQGRSGRQANLLGPAIGLNNRRLDAEGLAWPG